MKNLVDNGHGIETPGKQSPDGVLREYAWCRQLGKDNVIVVSIHANAGWPGLLPGRKSGF